ESCVPIKYEVKRTVRGAEREFEVELGDYKDVSGVMFPFAVALGGKGGSSAEKSHYAWERIELNVGLEDRRFTRPQTGAPAEPAADASRGGPSSSTRAVPMPAARDALAPRPSSSASTTRT